jgi:signal transduction histidine kinase
MPDPLAGKPRVPRLAGALHAARRLVPRWHRWRGVEPEDPPPPTADPAAERAVELLAHELRSRITTIRLGARVLGIKGKRVDRDARDEVLAALEADVDHLSRVLEDLLAVVRHESADHVLPVGPLLLQRWLPGILAAESTAHPGLQVRALVAPDLPPVLADDAALAQVVRNLLANAARFGPDTAPVEVIGEMEGSDVLLRIVDQGPGVDPEEAERLFEPFYQSARTSGAGGGTAAPGGAGLGLAAVRRLLGAMGSSIVARPRPGGGAEFVVRLVTITEDEPS